MNEYWATFFVITQSAEQLLLNESNSLEIQASARNVKESVHPCLEELKQSATRLKGLVHVCLDDLDYAEDVWNSKAIIVQAPTLEIWERLGEISGFDVSFSLESKKRETQLLKEIKYLFDVKNKEIKERWFIGKKGEVKKGVGWPEKAEVLKEINQFFKESFNQLSEQLEKNTEPLYKEATWSGWLDSLRELLQLLDSHAQKTWEKRLAEKFTNFINNSYRPLNTSELLIKQIDNSKNAIKSELSTSFSKWGDVAWEEITNIQNKIGFQYSNIITNTLNTRVEIATQAVKEAIVFYNYLLELQQRYQQESPEQSTAEKAWIDRQRQKFELVQQGIGAILQSDKIRQGSP